MKDAPSYSSGSASGGSKFPSVSTASVTKKNKRDDYRITDISLPSVSVFGTGGDSESDRSRKKSQPASKSSKRSQWPAVDARDDDSSRFSMWGTSNERDEALPAFMRPASVYSNRSKNLSTISSQSEVPIPRDLFVKDKKQNSMRVQKSKSSSARSDMEFWQFCRQEDLIG